MHSKTETAPAAVSDSRLALLTNAELERRLGATLRDERAAMVEFLLHLGEFDRRRSYLDRGYPSLFEYCTAALRLSKAAAFRRITAARLLRRFPAAADRLRDGRLCLTNLAELRDLLTEENCEALLRQASGLTREQVEALVAASRPAPAMPPPDMVMPLPSPKHVWLPAEALAAVAPTPESPGTGTAPPVGKVIVAVPQVPIDRVKPLSAELRVLRVTVSQAFLDDLSEVKLTLSHKLPDGRFEDVVRECFRIVLERDRARRCPRPATRKPTHARAAQPATAQAATSQTGTAQAATEVVGKAQVSFARASARCHGRYIPQETRRAVWARDRGRCAFRAPNGRVCGSRHRVQFHHLEPFGVGGKPAVDNLSLRCAAHNGLHARRDFGPHKASVPRAEPARQSPSVTLREDTPGRPPAVSP